MTLNILMLIADPEYHKGSHETFLDRFKKIVDTAILYNNTNIDIVVQLRLKTQLMADTWLNPCIFYANQTPSLKISLNCCIHPDSTRMWGIHFPERNIPEQSVPKRINQYTSAAIHSLEAAHKAHCAGIEIFLLAPIFAPRSKNGEGRGLDFLKTMTSHYPNRIIALGGISKENIKFCLQAGAIGVATLSIPMYSSDIHQAIHDLALNYTIES